MKLMPGEDFLKLLYIKYGEEATYVTQKTIDDLFENYGDDIYPRSDRDPDEIIENKKRKRMFEEYESRSINKSS